MTMKSNRHKRLQLSVKGQASLDPQVPMSLFGSTEGFISGALEDNAGSWKTKGQEELMPKNLNNMILHSGFSTISSGRLTLGAAIAKIAARRKEALYV